MEYNRPMTQIIIDTREKVEFAMGHVKDAINIPPAQFLKPELPIELTNLPLDAEIILYCRTGSRSNVVGHILRGRGFTNIVNGGNQQRVEQLLKSR